MKPASFLLALIFLTSSCASIFSKSNYDVTINSNPQGASFKILDRYDQEVGSGKTPQTVNLASSDGYFEKAHYTAVFKTTEGNEVKLPIKFHVDGWYIAGNFVVGGLIGWLLVDPLTGAMYTVDEEVINANLGGKSASTGAMNLKIMTVDEYTGDKSKLIPVNE